MRIVPEINALDFTQIYSYGYPLYASNSSMNPYYSKYLSELLAMYQILHQRINKFVPNVVTLFENLSWSVTPNYNVVF